MWDADECCALANARGSKFSPLYTVVINVVFWTVSLVPAAYTIFQIDDRKLVEDVHVHDGEVDPTKEGGTKETDV